MPRLFLGASSMATLCVGAPLMCAVLLCHAVLVGCGRRENSPASAGGQSTVASISSTTAATPAPAHAEAKADLVTTADASEPADSAASSSQQATSAIPSSHNAQAATQPAAASAAPAETAAANEPRPEQAWTTQRLVLLAPGGPRILDLRVNIDGSDLSTGLAEASEWLARELEFDFDAPIAWDVLLEKPLIQSGWFGNLVPTAEQRAELLAMYDKENAGKVDASEFQAFVTRGLSRRPHVRLAKTAAAPPLTHSTSPWGPLDQDDDGELSAEELQRTGEALTHFDFDGDSIVSEAELRSANETMAEGRNMSRTSGLLDLSLVIAADSKQPTALERAVHEQYTFGDTLSRDAFFAWDDRRWSELDRAAEGAITKRELAPLHNMLADAQVDVAFPNALQLAALASNSASPGANAQKDNMAAASPAPEEADASVVCQAVGDDGQASWTPGSLGGRLLLPGCVVLVQVRDDQSPQTRRMACQQMARALDEPQLASALAGPLELKEGAWDLLRERGGAPATARAWSWLVAPRHFHVSANWTVVERPWFELLDTNADRRLTGWELSEFRAAAQGWDRNLNGRLEEEELPLVVSLTLARDDSRLAFFSTGGMNMEKGGASKGSGPSWFTAMDYNLDGELTHAEFLGEDEAFAEFDANGDGIIEVREVYSPH